MPAEVQITTQSREPSEIRRTLGRYDTPKSLTETLAKWSVRKASDRVLEPSSGSGVFVKSILNRLTSLGAPRPRSQVWACDVDVTACCDTIRLTGLSANHVWNTDFVTLVQEGRGIAGRRFSCLIGNPPFVSLHRMSTGQRRRCEAAIKRLKLRLNKKASLWAYFALCSIHLLENSGRLAFILPECALHAEYAREVLKTLSTHFDSCVVVSIRERCFESDGAAERVVALLGDGFRSEPKPGEIRLKECLSLAEAEQFIAACIPLSSQPLPTLNGHAVPHLLPANTRFITDLRGVPNSHQLQTFAAIKIGIVTGANDFFLLSEPERKKHLLPKSAVIPVLPRFRGCTGLAFRLSDWETLRNEGEQCWLLAPRKDETHENVLKYLALFPDKKRDENRTFSKRSPWYTPQLGVQPHAFLRYMGASGPRFALSCNDVTCTNTVHRVYFNPDVTPLMQKAIALSLHSSFSQMSAEIEGRAYGSGVLKLEPSEAKRLRLLLPSVIAPKLVNTYFSAADKALRTEGLSAATAVVDEWLYEVIPNLATSLPLEALRTFLNVAAQRRNGYPHGTGSGEP